MIERAGNPAELAEPHALELVHKGVFDEHELTYHEQATLCQLDDEAEALGMIGRQYWVDSSKAFSIPVSFEADEPVRFIDFNKLSFEATFISFSTVRMRGLEGRPSIGAVCLAFDGSLLLPYFDRVPDEHLLYVPALAVDYMDLIPDHAE